MYRENPLHIHDLLAKINFKDSKAIVASDEGFCPK